MNKKYEFKWKWCALCATFYIECPKCGNNCCNGGYGAMTKRGKPTKTYNVKKTIPCDICPLAYQYQRLGWKYKDQPKPTKKQLKMKWKYKFPF